MENKIFLKPILQFWTNLCSVKVNTQTPHGNWSGGGSAGGALVPSHWLKLSYSTGEEARCFSTLLQQEGGGSPPSPATAQPMKSHYTSNSQPPPMDSLLTTAPLSSPFLYQRTFHAFVLLACRWFAIEPHVPNCHSLLFPNKPIVLEKYLFQVNSPLKCREWAEKFLERSL